ncbi:cysteine-rich motor neuron 1 protein-like [Ylistrum balloti]|uniref:cysteine-rich motor neuron 1 protein-like n=1 Tax=Ylistrum balloti TaxID=509963 RepID=UPI0029059455|nr:cysteine-rich motor neuron 1 protein-like [Ylistrum balloti]
MHNNVPIQLLTLCLVTVVYSLLLTGLTTIRMYVGLSLGSCLILTIFVVIDCYPEKRFLVSTNDHQRFFCFPPISYCHLQCPNGYTNSSNGCLLCQCRSPSQGVTSAPYHPQAPQSYIPNSLSPGTLTSGSAKPGSQTSGSFTSGYNMFTNPCQPQQMFCSLTCPHGFLTGNNGCHFCFCASAPHGTKAPPTTTSGPLTLLNNPCVASHHHCALQCNNGYLKGPYNCNYCLCKPDGLVITVNNTVAPTMTSKPTSPNPTGIVLPNPCIPNQLPCAMSCANGFVKGPQDCQYCLCAPSTVTTTTRPTTSISADVKPAVSHDSHKNASVASLPVASTISPDVANECIIATTICQLKCSGGFMIDPQHCTFCVCKDEMYNKTGIHKSDEPMILLQNPCVEEMDSCRIFCMTGYLRGPKDCQYCACRH